MKAVVTSTLLLLLILAFIVQSSSALELGHTQVLWILCQSNVECASAYSLSSPLFAGSTPLNDGASLADPRAIATLLSPQHPEDHLVVDMNNPQFRAFSKIVASACAMRESESQACHDNALLELNTNVLLEASQRNLELQELWLARLSAWAFKAGGFCGFNQQITIDPLTGELLCECVLNKSCEPDNHQPLDGVFLYIMIMFLLVVIAWSALQNSVRFFYNCVRDITNNGEAAEGSKQQAKKLRQFSESEQQAPPPQQQTQTQSSAANRLSSAAQAPQASLPPPPSPSFPQTSVRTTAGFSVAGTAVAAAAGAGITEAQSSGAIVRSPAFSGSGGGSGGAITANGSGVARGLPLGGGANSTRPFAPAARMIAGRTNDTRSVASTSTISSSGRTLNKTGDGYTNGSASVYASNGSSDGGVSNTAAAGAFTHVFNGIGSSGNSGASMPNTGGAVEPSVGGHFSTRGLHVGGSGASGVVNASNTGRVKGS